MSIRRNQNSSWLITTVIMQKIEQIVYALPDNLTLVLLIQSEIFLFTDLENRLLELLYFFKSHRGICYLALFFHCWIIFYCYSAASWVGLLLPATFVQQVIPLNTGLLHMYRTMIANMPFLKVYISSLTANAVAAFNMQYVTFEVKFLRGILVTDLKIVHFFSRLKIPPLICCINPV